MISAFAVDSCLLYTSYGDALVILSTAEIEGVVSNLRLQGLLNKHSSEISIMLKDLCSQGYLNPENKGRWTSYHSNKGIGLKQGSLFENLDGHLNEKMDTSDKKDGHLGRNMQEIKSSELKSYIVEICSSRYLTIEEIAVDVYKRQVRIYMLIIMSVRYLCCQVIMSVLERW